MFAQPTPSPGEGRAAGALSGGAAGLPTATHDDKNVSCSLPCIRAHFVVPELTPWLFLRHGRFYPAVSCQVADPDEVGSEGVLGVNLGQENRATDSGGSSILAKP